MATGFFDINGIWRYGEDDAAATMSELLDIGQDATSDVVATINNRLSSLEVPSPAWAVWNPVVNAAWTVGNGNIAGFQHVEGDAVGGKTIHYRLEFTVGSTSAFGTNPGFTLPAPRRFVNVPAVVGDVVFYDTSVPTRRFGVASVLPSTSSTALLYQNDGSSVTAASPFALAAGDFVVVTGSFERS